MMCCETTHHGAPAMHHASLSCCCFPRHFVSKEEHREHLEKYREQLKKELNGVEQALDKMK